MTETAEFEIIFFFCTARREFGSISPLILEKLGVTICQQNNSSVIVEYTLLSKPGGKSHGGL